MSDFDCRLSALYVHPVKSCGGIAVREALLDETGFEFDRTWMVVDARGTMLTQRDQPRMALVQAQFKAGELVLRAPGMLALHLMLDTVDQAVSVRVWDDVVQAYDMGALAAQWFSDFLGAPLRLARFDPEVQRLASAKWTGDVRAPVAFSDGYPLLVANAASLADLNARLAGKGLAPVTMQRFRPNLVLDGLQAFDEDHIDELSLNTPQGPVCLRLVKPCVRCSIPNVDPLTAASTPETVDTLAGYRADPRMQGGITFGVNAVVVQGQGLRLQVDQAVSARWRF